MRHMCGGQSDRVARPAAGAISAALGAMVMMVGASVVSVLAATPVAAQGLSLTQPAAASRSDVMRNQLRVLDGRLSEQYSRSDRLLPPAERRPETRIPAYTGGYNGPYVEMARASARRHNLPEDLFLRLVQQESRWNPDAVSHKGAIGLAQLMPGTAQLLGVDPTDPEQNLEGGARYLRMMHDRFGDWELALAAYNAGPGAVDAHGGIPPFQETRHYVQVILGPG